MPVAFSSIKYIYIQEYPQAGGGAGVCLLFFVGARISPFYSDRRDKFITTNGILSFAKFHIQTHIHVFVSSCVQRYDDVLLVFQGFSLSMRFCFFFVAPSLFVLVRLPIQFDALYRTLVQHTAKLSLSIFRQAQVRRERTTHIPCVICFQQIQGAFIDSFSLWQ